MFPCLRRTTLALAALHALAPAMVAAQTTAPNRRPSRANL